MSRFFSGNEGRATISATVLDITGWDFDDSAPALDTSNTGGAGFTTNIGSLKSGKGSVTANWDAAKNWTSSPPNVNSGQAVALKLYLENSSGPYWDIPSARITSVKTSSKVGSVVTVSFDFETNGSYTPPSGNF